MAASNETSRRAKVLVATASVGAGHNSAARAITAALADAAPGMDVEYLDVLTLTPWAFRAYYSGVYALAVTKAPWTYGLGYWVTNRPHRPGRSLTEHRRLWTERRAMKRLADRLLADPPDLIVHTHFLAPPVVAGLMARKGLPTRQMVVLTDNDTHRFWYSEHVERWFVPADHCAEGLGRWGIDPEAVTVSGIPVHPKWTRPLDRARVLADWNLPTDKQIVLVAAGTEFTCAPIEKIACRVADTCHDACAVVLAGNNKKLLGRLVPLARARPGRLLSVSFTDRVNELVDVCSLMVTKAGGITTAECLAKGTPMALLKPVPGQEAANARYFQREGAAVVVRRAGRVAEVVRRLLSDQAELKALGDNAARLYRPGTDIIVAAVCEALGPRAGCPPPSGSGG